MTRARAFQNLSRCRCQTRARLKAAASLSARKVSLKRFAETVDRYHPSTLTRAFIRARRAQPSEVAEKVPAQLQCTPCVALSRALRAPRSVREHAGQVKC